MADVFTLDSAYLTARRTAIKDDISYARYKVGNSWYTASIQSASVLNDGTIKATFTIDHTVVGSSTVTNVELYARNGSRIGSRAVSITRSDATEGILYICRIGLFQIVENSSGTGTYDKL